VPANTAPGSAEIEPIRGALRAVRFEVKGEGLHTGELEAREDCESAESPCTSAPGSRLLQDLARPSDLTSRSAAGSRQRTHLS